MGHVKLKFETKNSEEFIKDLRAAVSNYFELKKLSKYGNINIVLKSIFMFSLYLVPYFLMISGVIDSLIGVLACWVIIGVGKAGIGMGVMHDANHRTYSKNQKVNKWLGRTLYMLGGFPANWRHQHNTMHHGFTNIEGYDEDIAPGSYLRFSPHRPLRKIHRFQHIYAWILYGFMTILWVTTKDFTQLLGYKKEGVPLSNKSNYTQLLFSLITGKTLYYIAFLLLPMLVLPFAWYWVILFFFTMHFTTGFILTIIFQTAHVVPTSEFPLPDNNGSLENSWAVHQLLTTADFAPKSKVFSWFIGGLNYQIEHHLFPNISHVHYPKISKIVKQMAEKYQLPYHVQPGFIRALWEHGKMLKSLGMA